MMPLRRLRIATHACLLLIVGDLVRIRMLVGRQMSSCETLMAKRKNQGRRKSLVAGSSHDAPEEVEDRHTRLLASHRRRLGEDQDVGGTSDEQLRDPGEMTPEPSREMTPDGGPQSLENTCEYSHKWILI
ncbi:uncharacterized protein LOC130734523 [Lotus japonicus]|uniref:uncharacterized protein LOC130734523 n=1 Tax=Lotus japonicus TaxID=34305 RepID=UPI0025910556|nr:uncharacterized protein LOC130734523 [Lotus japonicus]